MHLPRARFTLRSTMIAVAIVGVASWAYVRYQHWTYYDSGWWEAERELWRGDATIYGSAGLRRGDLCDVDQDTGLPVQSPGCVADLSYDERMKGHNDHIAQFIRWHGLPKNTLKPWEDELFNLAHFFDDNSKIEVPGHLDAGGPGLVSPDGRHRVRLVKDATAKDLQMVVITVGDKVVADWNVHTGVGASLQWGPRGSRFVVIRSITETGERYVAYDLTTGRHLRSESRDIEQWSALRALSRTLAALRYPD
jgi:hypothetical protein